MYNFAEYKVHMGIAGSTEDMLHPKELEKERILARPSILHDWTPFTGLRCLPNNRSVVDSIELQLVGGL
jgi:hypothetical protein